MMAVASSPATSTHLLSLDVNADEDRATISQAVIDRFARDASALSETLDSAKAE